MPKKDLSLLLVGMVFHLMHAFFWSGCTVFLEIISPKLYFGAPEMMFIFVQLQVFLSAYLNHLSEGLIMIFSICLIPYN